MKKQSILLPVSLIALFGIISPNLSLADDLRSADLTLIDSQYNSSSWAAANLIDENSSTRWLSREQVNDLNFQFDTGGEAVCLEGFELTNYGNDDRSVQEFMLLTTTDAGLAADSGTDGWRPIVADETPSDNLDYLSWAQGGRIVSIDSQYNSTTWAAANLNDGSSTSRWLSRTANNIIEYNFDTDWNGQTGNEVPISEIEVVNYGNDDRSVKYMQVEVTTDGATWQKLKVPGTDAGDPNFNYAYYQNGGQLDSIDDQYNSSSWAARNMHDGDLNTRWLNRGGNAFFEYSFDPDIDGTTGSDGDIDDLFTLEHFNIVNYGAHDRSVYEFQVAVKTTTNTDWQKIPVPGSLIGESDFDFTSSHNGGTLTTINGQYNSSTWAAANIHDGDSTTRWLSRDVNNNLDFQFDVNNDGVLSDASDVFTFDKIYLQNYGNHGRSVQQFQVAVKTTANTDWQLLRVPGASIGESDFNFALQNNGGELSAISSQYNSTSWAAANIHDGDENSRWLSRSSNNTLDFHFDADGNGTAGESSDKFSFEAFYLANYDNHARAIRQFQVEVKIDGSSDWQKVPVPGSVAGEADYNFVLTDHGGNLDSVDSEYNSSSWAGANLTDGDNNSRWLSRSQTNTFVYSFDTDYDGATGDSINLDKIELTNYDAHNRAVATFEIDVQTSDGTWQTIDSPDGGTEFVANRDSNGQSWSITAISNVISVRFRTLTNHGDVTFTGARELILSGDSVDQSHTFTGTKSRTGETFELESSIDDVLEVRLRTINNYGDPSFVGAREFKVLGTSIAETTVFTAENHDDGQTFSLDADDIPVDVTDVRFITINNYGDPSFIGARQFKVFGDSITRSKTFTAARSAALQTFTLDVADRPENVTDVRLIIINNYGDPSYTGLAEFEVVGPSVTPGYIFELPQTSTPYKITLDVEDQVSDIIGAKIITIQNHGDPSYTGAAEFRLLGTPVSPSYVFTAEQDSTTQSFNFPSVSSNVFRFHSLNNHGDPSYMGAAEFAVLGGTCLAPQWRMDSGGWLGNANEVEDSSGNGYDGQAFGFDDGDGPQTSSLTSALIGDPGSCSYADFDGQDDYISVPNGIHLDNLTQLTLAAWIRPHTFNQSNGNDSRGIFSKGPVSAGEVAYGAFFDGSNNKLNIDLDGSGDRYQSSTNFSADTWYHIAIVFDGTLDESERGKLYINGILDGTFSESSNQIANDNSEFYIANFVDNNDVENVFDGFIDEVNFRPFAMQAAEVSHLMDLTRDCTVPLHHIELSHDGDGLTCSTESITLKACSDAACTSVSPTDVVVTLTSSSATSSWSTNPVTITGGNTAGTSVELTHRIAETITLGASSLPASSSATICSDGSSSSCDLIFSNSGYLLTLDDHASCSTTTLSIQAVQLSDTGVSCAPAYTGNQSVDFEFSFASPNTGTVIPNLSGTAMAAAKSTQTRTINFDATATAELDFEYDDAGQISLTVTDSGNAGLASSSLNVVTYPSQLVVSSSATNADCATGDSSCTGFTAAGEEFVLDIAAQCADGTVTSNFVLADTALTVNDVAPALGNPVSLGVTSFDFVAADAGEHQISNQSISEVGVFSITATPPNSAYFGHTIAASTSDSLGRFYPFQFNLNSSNVSHANGTTTYMGQAEIGADYEIEAQNRSGDTTLNYQGDFENATVVMVAEDDNDGTELSSRLSGFAGTWTNGIYQDDGTLGEFSRTTNIDGPYDLLEIGVRVTDPDGPVLNDLDMKADADTDCQIVDNCDAQTLTSAGNQIRFARWLISNAYGTELDSLIAPMTIQYWNGSTFVTSSDDNSTTYDTASDSTLTYTTLSSGTTSASGSGTFTAGETEGVILAAPGEGNIGAVELEFTVPAWLQYDWENEDSANDGPYDDDPIGTVTFGRFRGNDRVIYKKERY